MSSKKEYTTIGMDAELLGKIRREAAAAKRSISFIIEERVAESYELREEGKGVVRNAK